VPLKIKKMSLNIFSGILNSDEYNRVAKKYCFSGILKSATAYF
jgi:hypothetical protein